MDKAGNKAEGSFTVTLQYTAPNGGSRGGLGGSMGDGGPNLGATPELSSLALFGSGAAGMAGYALRRLRAGQSARKKGR